jgi:signal transduction histidine kinase
LTLTTVHMMEAAERARLQMAPLAAKGQATLTVGGDLDAEAYADSDRVHQVLINLLNNAIAFSTPGGQVSIVVRREQGDVTCTVQDTGIGIAATELPHVFERFYRGDASRARTISSPDGGGAGLGLAIAKVIVEAHGGQIWITSQLGQGTAVTFTLPGRPVTGASSVPSAPST